MNHSGTEEVFEKRFERLYNLSMSSDNEWTRDWASRKVKELHYEYLRARRLTKNIRGVYVR